MPLLLTCFDANYIKLSFTDEDPFKNAAAMNIQPVKS